MEDQSSSPKSEDFIRIEGSPTSGSPIVYCAATLHWRELSEIHFECSYDTRTGAFKDFRWTKEYGERVVDDNGYLKNVSISMKEKFYSETGEAVEAVEMEVLDDSKNRFLFVVMSFVSEEEERVLYGKKVDGTFEGCALSSEEKTRLQLE